MWVYEITTLCVCAYECAYVRICVSICACVCVYVCMYVYMYVCIATDDLWFETRLEICSADRFGNLNSEELVTKFRNLSEK
jgi:hypothetical protein